MIKKKKVTYRYTSFESIFDADSEYHIPSMTKKFQKKNVQHLDLEKINIRYLFFWNFFVMEGIWYSESASKMLSNEVYLYVTFFFYHGSIFSKLVDSYFFLVKVLHIFFLKFFCHEGNMIFWISIENAFEWGISVCNFKKKI